MTDFSDDDVHNESVIDDNDDGFSVNAGVLFSPHEKFSIGAVYRSGTEFTVKEECGRGVCPWGLDPTENESASDVAEFTLKVPDSFGAGIALKPNNFLTFTFDVVHIRYENLLEDFDFIFNNEEFPASNNDYTVDNATELHLGAEYILTFDERIDERIVTLRAGIYTDPDHTIRFTGMTGDDKRDARERVQFPGGDDQIHVTCGMGIVFNEHFQIDTAANISENNTQFSISSVYRF